MGYYEKGYKDQTCCPRTLQEEHFENLRANAGCFEWHHATVQETMERVKPKSLQSLFFLITWTGCQTPWSMMNGLHFKEQLSLVHRFFGALPLPRWMTNLSSTMST